MRRLEQRLPAWVSPAQEASQPQQAVEQQLGPRQALEQAQLGEQAQHDAQAAASAWQACCCCHQTRMLPAALCVLAHGVLQLLLQVCERLPLLGKLAVSGEQLHASQGQISVSRAHA